MAEFGRGREDKPAKRKKSMQKQQGMFALPPVYEHNEPRCKICQCPFRREIDMALVTGWSQAGIVRHFNVALGDDYLNRSNLSRHKERHLSSRDAGVRNIVEERARAFGVDVENAQGFIMTRQATLDLIIQQGLEAMRAGITSSQPRDILEAVQILEKMEKEFQDVAMDEMMNQYKAFADAVQELVPEDLWERIFDKTQDILGERAVGPKIVRMELPELAPLAEEGQEEEDGEIEDIDHFPADWDDDDEGYDD